MPGFEHLQGRFLVMRQYGLPLGTFVFLQISTGYEGYIDS